MNAKINPVFVGLRLIPIVFLMFWLSLPAFAAAQEPASSTPPTIEKFRITAEDARGSHPSISGNYVVWADQVSTVSAMYGTNKYDIYTYNLDSKEKRKIITEQGQVVQPMVAGDLLIWQRDEQFFGYRLGKEGVEEFPIAGFHAFLSTYVVDSGIIKHVHYNAALSTRTLVWADLIKKSIVEIMAFDLKLDTLIRITNDTVSQSWPASGGNLIVWTDRRYSNDDIYAYDMDKHREFPIVVAPSEQKMPSTDGKHVVWVDTRNGNDDIYGYNIETQTEFPIVTGSCTRLCPAVSGRYAIWREDDGANAHIYGYDLQTKTRFPIAAGARNEVCPCIWNNTVIWTQWGGKDYPYTIIYAATIK